MTSIYSFKVESISGEEIDFSAFKGKKILIVNVASECGLTPQYTQLQDLYTEFKDKLIVVGFPANNFGGQEPGTNQEIQTFCSVKFSVKFPMAAKVSVMGVDQHLLYQWLTQKSANGVMDSVVTWNFQKYLINEQGQLVQMFDPNVEPCSEEVIEAIRAGKQHSV